MFRFSLFLPAILLAACTRVIPGNDLGLLLFGVQNLVRISETSNSTTVTEAGSSDTYTIVLTRRPAADVSLSVTSDSQLTLGADHGRSLVLNFSPDNWNQPQSITVSALDDSVREGTHTGLIAHGVSSADADFARSNPGNLTVSIQDDDGPAVILTQSGDSTNIAEAGTTSDAYSIRLNTQPASDVIVSIAFDENQLQVNGSAVSPVNITFNSSCPSALCWSTARNITVTAVDDALNESTTHTGLISHAASSGDPDYSGISIADVSASITDNDGDVTAPTVVTVDPSEGTSVGSNVSISITFSEAMNATLMTTNTADTSCSGVIQVSRASDNFAASTCVRMDASPTAENGNRIFTVKPQNNLAANEVYLVRVTTSAQDQANNPLATVFTTTTGIQTGLLPDTTPPEQSTGIPSVPDALEQDVSLGTSITITMNDFLLPSTMSTNVQPDTTCSGTFQLSLDGFASCVPMQSRPVPGANHTIWTVTPLAPLAEDTVYSVRVSGTRDAAGNLQVGAITWQFHTVD